MRNGHQSVKRRLASLGGVLPDRLLYDIDGALNYLEVGAFMRRRGFQDFPRLSTKHDVWDVIAHEVSHERVLYLEFGVADGASMRHWSRLLQNPASILHGFDSFEGLPVDWIPDRPAGFHTMNGKIPDIPDPRVTFFKGLFDETLPGYTWPTDYDRLVVNLDADLYTSTVVALEAIEDHLTPGTYLYFDEFNQRAHEMRAFAELMDRTGMRFEVVAAVQDLSYVAFRRLD